jgi:hypothetical protein
MTNAKAYWTDRLSAFAAETSRVPINRFLDACNALFSSPEEYGESGPAADEARSLSFLHDYNGYYDGSKSFHSEDLVPKIINALKSGLCPELELA